jgi:hypothetical protein
MPAASVHQQGSGVVDIPKRRAPLRRLHDADTLALEDDRDAKGPRPGSAGSVGDL